MLINLSSVNTYAQTITPQQILKLAVRDAEILVKAGWKPSVNMPPIERQLNNAYLRENRMSDGEPQFIMGSSRRRGLNYQTAHSEAMAAAKKEVVNKMESNVSSEFKNITISKGTNTSQHNSMNTRVSSMQRLRKIEPVIDIFRELKDGEVEVEIRIAYDKKSNGN